MLEKIIKKDKNEELEKVLEEKMIDEQAKNLLQGILYKIEVSYKDYKKVKVINESEKKYVEQLILNIKKNCKSIKVIKLSQKIEDDEIQKILKKYKFYIKDNEILSYPIEKKLLYAIEKLSNNYKILNNKYGDATIAVSDFINLGKDMDRIEVLRDFNGWSWTTIKQEIENIDANFVFQAFQILFGKEFMDQWCQDKDGIIDYFEVMSEEFCNKFGKERINKLKELLIQLAIINDIKESNEFAEYIQKKKMNLEKDIKYYDNTKENVERITRHKKQLTKQLKEIEKILNQKEKLQLEYQKQEKIFNINMLKQQLNSEKQKILAQIEEDNYILNPQNYLAEKEKLIKQKEFLEISLFDEDKRKSLLMEFIKIWLQCFNLSINSCENPDEVLKLIYQFRYFMFLPYDLNRNLKDVEQLNEETKKTEILLFKKAIQKKIVSNMPFEIITHLFETRIIGLNELYYKIIVENEKYFVQIFDDNISEEKFEIIPVEKMKINKKIKIFI